MTKFTVEKEDGYTVMSNHHLRNKELSLKAKGLLSQMLSLPDNWDYTLRGLACINREKIDAIREAVKELERAGYIVRKRSRDSKGCLRGNDYIIYSKPQTPKLEKPTLENPTLEKPTLENPTQLNKDIINKDLLTIDSFPFIPEKERKGYEVLSTNATEAYYDIIKSNIEYDILKDDKNIDSGCLSELVDLMVEMLCTTRKTIKISGNEYPAELVKSRILEINSMHIQFIFDCLKQNTTKIKNIKNYMLAVLFNAKTTMENYYSALYQHNSHI